MTRIILFLAFLGFYNSAHADQILAQGPLESATPLGHAFGEVRVTQDAQGSQFVSFSSDYDISSGVVLDLQVCGEVFPQSDVVCLSQGELRVLRGEYTMPLRFPLMSYSELRIFDLDLSQIHAYAKFTVKFTNKFRIESK